MSSRAPFQSHIEDVLMDIFFSLLFPAGTANTPQNIIKNIFSTEPDFHHRMDSGVFFRLIVGHWPRKKL
jgi:hypothetical protein